MLVALLLAAVGTALGTSPTRDGTYAVGPKFTADPATLTCCKDGDCTNCPKGESFYLFMPIKDTVYDCADSYLKDACAPNCGQIYGTPGTRNITVYVPAMYKDGNEAGVMTSQDGGFDQLGAEAGIGEMPAKHVRNTMDNLMGKTGERSLPTFIWISIGIAGPGGNPQVSPECADGKGTERFLEYGSMSSDYARFVNDQVLPFVLNHGDIKAKFPNIKFTKDPEGHASAGCSNGAGAAMKSVLLTPELFGIAIAYSASLQDWDAGGDKKPLFPSVTTYPRSLADIWIPAPEGMELIKTWPKKNIRVFHSSSDRDFGTPRSCFRLFPFGIPGYNFTQPVPIPGKYMNFLEANNKTEAALVAKGYETRYAYGLDTCHCQEDYIAEDFPNTLVWAWAKWKKKTEAAAAATALRCKVKATKKKKNAMHRCRN